MGTCDRSAVFAEALRANPKLAGLARRLVDFFKREGIKVNASGKLETARAVGFYYVVVGSEPDYDAACLFAYRDRYSGQPVLPLCVGDDGTPRESDYCVATLESTDVEDAMGSGLLLDVYDGDRTLCHEGVILRTDAVDPIETRVVLIFRDREIVETFEACLDE